MNTEFKSVILFLILCAAAITFVLPAPVSGDQTLCLTDFNQDQAVDALDLAAFSEHYGRTDCSTATPCNGDFAMDDDSDGPDGDSDGQDLALLIKEFGRTDCPGAAFITIITPVDGAQIARPHVLVRGTIDNPNGYETGVTVNGHVALVYGSQFAANHIPLQNGANTIDVVATMPSGNTTSTLINVTADTTGDYLRLRAHPEAGTAPLDVKLLLEPTLPFTDTGITGVDPAAAALTENTKTEFLARLDTPGITFFTAAYTDTELHTYADEVAVVVLDRTELDALLKAKWNGMKTSLSSGNVEGALTYFLAGSRENYRLIFTALQPQLPDIASAMREIELITIDEKAAKYRLKRLEEAQGQTVDISYFIYFIKDYRGLWYLDRF